MEGHLLLQGLPLSRHVRLEHLGVDVIPEMLLELVLLFVRKIDLETAVDHQSQVLKLVAILKDGVGCLS